MSIYLHLRNAWRARLGRSLLGKILLANLSRPATGTLHIVSATRMDEESFWSKSALGQTLQSYRSDPQLRIQVHFQNKRALPLVYNEAIRALSRKDLLLLVHDDVWFDNDSWIDDIRKGLARFDVIGVAGNRRLTAQHPAWLFSSQTPAGFVWDSAFLSGAVGHGPKRGGSVHHYGFTPAECKALDGVFLAFRADALRTSGVLFDERFHFHFYDLDFCRSASSAGLKMGTWPVSLTHQSAGNFASEAWKENYAKYLDKWSKAPDLN